MLSASITHEYRVFCGDVADANGALDLNHRDICFVAALVYIVSRDKHLVTNSGHADAISFRACHAGQQWVKRIPLGSGHSREAFFFQCGKHKFLVVWPKFNGCRMIFQIFRMILSVYCAHCRNVPTRCPGGLNSARKSVSKPIDLSICQPNEQ